MSGTLEVTKDITVDGYYYGDGSNLTGVMTTGADYVLKAGDTMTGTLTVGGGAIGISAEGGTYGVYGSYNTDNYGYIGSVSHGGYFSAGGTEETTTMDGIQTHVYVKNGTSFGIRSYGHGYGSSGSSTGLYGEAVGETGNTAGLFGVYGTVSGDTGTVKWAGYFTGGDGVYLEKFTVGNDIPQSYNVIGDETTSHGLNDANDLLITGSLEVNGYTLLDGGVTATSFSGDGSQLTNVPADGGNADTLDSLDSTAFVLAAGDIMTGTLTVGGSAYGVSAEGSIYGVYGSGASAGVYGKDSGGDGYGYLGYGVVGLYAVGSLAGLRAQDSVGSGVGYVGYGDWGIYGTGAIGVSGEGSTYGVYGSGASAGVYGRESSGEGYGYLGYHPVELPVRGVYGFGPIGVYGEGMGRGVVGVTASSEGYGGYFEGASSTGRGVYGYASSASGTNYGVYGKTNSSAGYGVYSEGNAKVAGSLEVTGPVDIGGNLTKGGGAFLIDHPLDPRNKVLRHSFVESPDMKNIYDGIVLLDEKGEAVVTLPDYFEVLNKDFRYQLTPIGAAAVLYVKEKISNNRFVIAGGQGGMEVSWQVTGTRKDAFAEKNRIVVEEVKGSGNKYTPGTYIHPEAFK